MFPAAVLRILDANANRAVEGLRVVEEYARFVRGDALWTESVKRLRHDLSEALRPLALEERLAARDTTGDVGTAVSTAGEASRSDVRHAAEANLKRAQEALRAIEEYSKIAWPDVARQCEQLRYRTYTLEKLLLAAQPMLATRLATAQLYVLIDGLADEASFMQRAQLLVDAKVDVLQLRDKQLDDRTLLARARALRRVTRDTQTLMVVNDRPDLALLAQADGVHVGQDELAVQDVRTLVGPHLAIGVSTHSVTQARQAVLEGADYLGCGPTFASETKQFRELAGLELLRHVAELTAVPAFAIGGITPENLPQVLATGARRVAMRHAIWNAADPGAAARQVQHKLSSLAPLP